MGRHSLNRHGNRMRDATDAVDPERRELVEPDRDGSSSMSSQERAARSRVHTDRDPEDDIHLAAADPRDTHSTD